MNNYQFIIIDKATKEEREVSTWAESKEAAIKSMEAAYSFDSIVKFIK